MEEGAESVSEEEREERSEKQSERFVLGEEGIRGGSEVRDRRIHWKERRKKRISTMEIGEEGIRTVQYIKYLVKERKR